MQEVYFTVQEIAARYRVTPSAVSGWLRSGILPGIRVGGTYRVRAADLLAFERPAMATASVPTSPKPDPKRRKAALERLGRKGVAQ